MFFQLSCYLFMITVFLPFLFSYRSDGASTSTSEARRLRRRSISITPEIGDDIVRLIFAFTINFFLSLWMVVVNLSNSAFICMLRLDKTVFPFLFGRGSQLEKISGTILERFMKYSFIIDCLSDAVSRDWRPNCIVLKGMLRIPYWKDEETSQFLKDTWATS